ncbi:hypothetical protein HHI_14317 [Hyphomonas hirschiana VP5]|uniref:Uncharacterized protein n=1 Tax=Hyphomonas hirschiana VP5 TaxID=1280951 RepID=A0A059FFF2_9PROT|nr:MULTISPECIES: hypothetical protein [Hyphomonas]KCZ89332.1 hypothetical protein HHI_14317 [Hyphomonas hirschiana VP5]
MSDVSRFQTAILQPTEEATPAYLQNTAETFISDCPDRFEAREAHLIAARGALDAGEASDAVSHYASAIARGARLSPAQRLDQSVALLAAGNQREALEVRNLGISEWLETLTAEGMSEFDIRKSRGGVILAVSFSQQDPEAGVRALWLAVPDGPGLPAAAVLRADPMRASLRALRTGREPAALTILEQRTCQDARILKETAQPAAVESFDRVASEAMRSYLREPEGLTKTTPGQPLASCLMPELMLPAPAPAF